jgi:hypothetical protein
VGREHAPDDVFVKEQAVGLRPNGRLDTGSEGTQCHQPTQGVDPHPQVDHDQLRIAGKVDGYLLSFRHACHRFLLGRMAALVTCPVIQACWDG